jgi:hypothetical protein
MNGQHGFPVLKADTQHGTERRRSPRYRFSEAMAVQCPGDTLMTGISVEISQGGMSTMVNGLLQLGDAAETLSVSGCPRSGQSAAQTRATLWFRIHGNQRGADPANCGELEEIVCLALARPEPLIANDNRPMEQVGSRQKFNILGY